MKNHKDHHVHEYVPGHSNKIAKCSCGDWKHINLAPEDIITEQRAPQYTLTLGDDNKIDPAKEFLKATKTNQNS